MPWERTVGDRVIRSLENGDKGWVLISETGTDGNYVACRLLNDGGARYKIGFPQQGEMNGWGTTNAAVSLPAETPWRTITVGTTLKNIVETTVPLLVMDHWYGL